MVNTEAGLTASDDVPLSFAQERLWFLEQFAPSGSTYHVSIAFRLQGDLDVRALERSVTGLIRRHDSLRTHFEDRDGIGVQVIDACPTQVLQHLRLTEIDPEQARAEERAILQQGVATPFDLTHGPMLRVILLQKAEREHLLLLVVHHIVADGWSTSLMLQELGALYASHSKGLPESLPEPPMQFPEYARWQRRRLRGDRLEQQLAYWRRQLTDMPAELALPTDRRRPAKPSLRGGQQAFALSPECVRKLTQLAHRERATLYMVLLSGLQVVLSRWSNQEDIVVGSPVAGRTHRKTHAMVGSLANTLVMRTDLSGNPTFVQLLARVRKVALQAYAYQDLPLELLIAELQPRRDSSRPELLQVMLALHNEPPNELMLTGLSVTPVTLEQTSAKLDLLLSLVHRGENLAGSMEYAEDLFDAATIERLLESYQVVLEAVAREAHTPIADLPLMSQERYEGIAAQWSATLRAQQRGCLHQLFVDQCARTPRMSVGSFAGRSLTYDELDRHSNQVAHYLRERSVGSEICVAVYMERSPERLATLLGILKAGGAYVLLERNRPPSVSAALLRKSQPRLILTQAHLSGELPEAAAPITFLGSSWSELAGYPETALAPASLESELRNLACFVYAAGLPDQDVVVVLEHASMSRERTELEGLEKLLPPAHSCGCVLDPNLQPRPVGVTGEVYLGGAGVARGYLQAPRLTAERFLPSVLGPPAERMYRSGRRGRWRPDGSIEFLADDELQLATLPRLDESVRPAWEAPQGPMEERLAELWRSLLRTERLGRQDNFFALGGHSLLAMQLAARARDSIGVELPLRVIFESPTIQGMANWIAHGGSTAQGAEMPALRPRPRDTGPLLLSYAQERLWFLERLGLVGSAYHVPQVLLLQGALNTQALERCWSELLVRHESLRTRFEEVDGQPVQRIDLPTAFHLPIADLAAIAGEKQTAQVRQRIDAAAQDRFDLEAGPLIRIQLLRLSEEEHMLLLMMHHIICDGWSVDVLIRELSELYTAFCNGKLSPLSPLSIQYADYAQWQREWLQGEVLQRQLDYWRQQLAGAPASLQLPLDRPRSALASFKGAVHPLRLPAQLWSELLALSSRAAVTPFMLLLAAFHVLLWRWSGQDDIVVGSPSAARAQAGAQGLVGFLVNMLPLRIQLSSEMSFMQLLGQVRRVALEAYAHQDIPFEKLVAELQPHRDLSRQPLFQVTLALQNPAPAQLELPALTIRPVTWHQRSSKFDLSLELQASPGGLEGTLEYATDLFEPATIARLADHFERVLREIGTDAQRPVASVPLLADSEREQLVVRWNATREPHPHDKCIHDLFEQQVQLTPETVALVAEDQQLTYAELEIRSNQLAHYLRAHGVSTDVRVGLCLERGIDMVIGLLGILKSGGAYVPVDPGLPRERRDYILEDAAALMTLTETVLDRDREAIERQPHTPPSNPRRPQDLAYVIYTSGSTGRPKGVMVEHLSVTNFLIAMQRRLRFGPEEKLLAVTTVSFDIAGLEVYLPLISGAQVVLLNQEASANAATLGSTIEELGITTLQGTPATWKLLLAAGWHGNSRLKALCGGEALPADLAAQIRSRVGALWNLYGPTETTVWSCARELPALAQHAQSTELLGGPIANTQVYILDTELQPAPIGVVGEIHIAGAGVARGYRNRPALTAERFVADPFADTGGGRMYRTGDLGRWRADGHIEYTGRNDHQVKIRGYRVELEEIESQLRRHGSVADAVVAAREDAPGDKRLVAYITGHERAPADGAGADALGFSLFYFGADTYAPDNKYELYLQSLEFADSEGFEAVWTPERHFDLVGSLYPNPSVLSAAAALMTQRVKLRAGSVVLPLHDPLRTAEEWAVVDNLSHGRVGIALASGWHSRDFVLAPHSYASRKTVLLESAAALQTLWGGGKITRTDGAGKQVAVGVFPRPVQARLPLWLTSAGSPETFIDAGRLGFHVLTHLLSQGVEELREKIALYRNARLQHGHDPDAGRVTVMVHTFLGQDLRRTVEQAREPFLQYLRAHLGLQHQLAQSLGYPTAHASAADLDNIVSLSFERYVRTASLIGTVDSTLGLVSRLREIGVNEIACLIDWMDVAAASAGLPPLAELRRRSATARPSPRTLSEHCKAALPEYMVPAAYVFLEQLPLTPNGKLDRKALPAPQLHAYSVGQYSPPQGELEEELAALWKELLRVESIGRDDNFFELGGHSLLAVQVAARIQKAFGVAIPLVDLFVFPTVAELAKAVFAQTLAQFPQEEVRRVTAEVELLSERELWVQTRDGGGVLRSVG